MSDLFEKRHGLTPAADPSDDSDDSSGGATDDSSPDLVSWTAEDSKAVNERVVENHEAEFKTLAAKLVTGRFESEEERQQMLHKIASFFREAAEQHLEERDG